MNLVFYSSALASTAHLPHSLLPSRFPPGPYLEHKATHRPLVNKCPFLNRCQVRNFLCVFFLTLNLWYRLKNVIYVTAKKYANFAILCPCDCSSAAGSLMFPSGSYGFPTEAKSGYPYLGQLPHMEASSVHCWEREARHRFNDGCSLLFWDCLRRSQRRAYDLITYLFLYRKDAAVIAADVVYKIYKNVVYGIKCVNYIKILNLAFESLYEKTTPFSPWLCIKVRTQKCWRENLWLLKRA